MSTDLALLILRLVTGLTIAAHGSQKLFGWFGGGGFAGTLKMTEQMRLRPTQFWALMSGLAEFGGGILLALGLLSPIGSLGVMAAMLMAIITAHWPRFFNGKGGMEFPLLILTSALTVGISGPGAFSLDALIGLALPEPVSLLVGIVVVIAGIVLALVTRQPAAPVEATPQQQ